MTFRLLFTYGRSRGKTALVFVPIAVALGLHALSKWNFLQDGAKASRVSHPLTRRHIQCDLTPYDLTLEHLSSSRHPQDLVTIDPDATRAPRFSFKAFSSTTPSPEAIASHVQVIRPCKESDCIEDDQIVWDSKWILAGRRNGLDITRDHQLDGLVPMERLLWRARFGIAGAERSSTVFPCPWSELESFLVGPSREQWEQADWICAPNNVETECDFYDTNGKAAAPLFRTEFELPLRGGNTTIPVAKAVASAKLFVAGLGNYEAWINGVQVNRDRYLDPAPSSYDKRIYYNSFDVTDEITQSNTTRQVLGFVVGNGWFNPLPMKFWGHLNFREYLPVGTPRVQCILVIEFEGKSFNPFIITTSLSSNKGKSSWKTASSALLRNDLYLGNVVDLDRLHWLDGWSRMGSDSPFVQWHPVEGCSAMSKVAGRPPVLTPQPVPPIRSRLPHQLKAVSTKMVDNDLVLDMGLNTAAAVRVEIFVPDNWVCSAQEIELKFGELLLPNGTVNVYTSVAGHIVEDGCCGPCAPALGYQRMILRTTRSAQYTTQFSWSGFRYIQISSLPTGWEINVAAIPLMTDLKWTSSFESSNTLLNDIYKLCWNTHASNMMGIQSDCPHRERLGYTGDAFATLPTSLAFFDGPSFYEKRLYDVKDSLRENGGVTETAPFVGISSNGLGNGSGPIGWQSFFPAVQLELYRYYGNTRARVDMRNDTTRWVELVMNHTYEVEHGLGDWMAIEKTPLAISGRVFLVEALRAWAKLSFSDKEKATATAMIRKELREFEHRFLSNETGDISNNGSASTQAGQAFSLYYNMISKAGLPRVSESLVRAVEKRKRHIATGMFGVLPLFEALASINRMDLAWDIVTQTTYPSYGYMLENNATTIWESWFLSNSTSSQAFALSHNHPMFSGVASWMLSHIGGVRIAKDAIGADRIIFAPSSPVTSNLKHASTVLDTARGKASCEWKCQTDGTMFIEIACPVNTRGVVVLPDGSAPKAIRGGRYRFRARAPLCQRLVSTF